MMFGLHEQCHGNFSVCVCVCLERERVRGRGGGDVGEWEGDGYATKFCTIWGLSVSHGWVH